MTIVYSKSLIANNVGWSGYGVRVACLTTAGGTSLRATFVAPTSGNHFKVDNVSVAIQGGAAAPSSSTTPVELKFSTVSGFDLLPGQTVQNDPLAFTWAAGDTLIFAMKLNSSVAVDLRLTAGGSPGAYFKLGANDWNTGTVSGYTNPNYASFGISQIEDLGGSPPPPPSSGDLVIIGDSVSVPSRTGGGSTWATGQGWAALLAASRNLTEINYAVSGVATSAMSSQWASALALSPKPKLIIAMPGENDINVTAVATFKSALDTQVKGAMSSGIPIILATPWIWDDAGYLLAARSYTQAIKEIATLYRVPLVDVFDSIAAVRGTDSALYATLAHPDGHPTVAGQAWLKGLYDLIQHNARILNL